MTINYTSLLGLAQPVTGTQSGTWGGDVNNGLTAYLDAAIAGAQILSTDADVTLSITNGDNTATNLGATSAQYAILNCTGARTAQRSISVPNSSKTYWVLNQTTGGYSVKVRGVTGPTTGVTIANGRMALVAWNGADFSVVASNDVTALLGFGTGVAAALGVNVGSAGAVVVNGGSLGTPTSGTLTNATGLPVSTGVSGLGTGVATALAVNTGASGAVVVNGGALGTPSSGNLANASGLPISTGVSGLGAGVATALGANTGTAGAFIVNGGGLGTPSSGTLTNATGLPISTGVSGLGTNVATALAVNTGAVGSFVVLNSALGTPSSGTLTNATGLPISTGVSGLGTGVGTALGNNANAATGFVTGNGTATLTNKRIDPRVSSTASASSVTPDISAYDIYAFSSLAVTLGINAPIGTPADGDKLTFRILDNGSSQTLNWNAIYTAIGVTLPTATTANKMTYVGCIYNASNTRWDVIAVSTQV